MLPEKKTITTCGLQTNCKHSFIIQNICISFTWTTGTVFGSRTAGRTAWISPGRRLEEHLVTANLVLDKADAVGLPVWIISLDLSKAFDRVHWPALWTAIVYEGIPVHLVWILQCVYFGQCGEVVGDMGQSSKFNITGGVRQGCVLSPRLFCSVLQWAIREWRAEVGNVGFNLMDRGPNLLDLRFADDILVFGRSRVEAGNLLAALVKHLDRVGLLWNTDKTVVITNEAQPPQTITTTAGMNLKVLPRDGGLKWLGSMLTSCGSKLQCGFAISSYKPVDIARQKCFHYKAFTVL